MLHLQAFLLLISVLGFSFHSPCLLLVIFRWVSQILVYGNLWLGIS